MNASPHAPRKRVSPAPRHRATVVLMSSLWMASVGNVALWQQLAGLPEISRWHGLGFGIGFSLIIAALLVVTLSVLAWGWLLRPMLTLLLLATAAGAYFMLTYGVVIDTPMLVNVLQTDPREVRDLLNWRLFAALGLLGMVPAWWLWRRPLKPMGVRHHIGTHGLLLLGGAVATSGLLMLTFQDVSSVMRNHTRLRYLINPLNTLYAIADVAAKPLKRDESRFLPVGEDARLAPRAVGAKPPLLVLVLGETARADNFGINGYTRSTTPALARENVVSQRNAWSCGTSTAESVPCMFSHLPRDEFQDRKTNTESLMDVLQRAGLAVLWLDNQSGCKGVCDRVPRAATAQFKTGELCDGDECFDEAMLRGLDDRLAALPAERRDLGIVLVLHQMGSHGPAYYKRSPPAFKKFLPECTSNSLPDCDRQALVNAYDNSIAYTDHFLGATLQWLKTREAQWAPALVYVSDHGESLGENNLYLHGLPWRVAPDVQKHVPWITWLSPGFEQARNLRVDCLRQRADAPVSHDHYFHSVIGLAGVQTTLYRPELDLYAPCRSH